MRIGFDASKLLPPRDGSGNFAYFLLRALLAQAGADHRFLLFGLTDAADRQRLTTEVGLEPGAFEIRTAFVPAPGDVDIYHSLAYAFPNTLDAPALYTCHDLTVLTHPQFHTVDNKVGCLTGLLRALNAGALLTADSRATRDELCRYFALPQDRVEVVYGAAGPGFVPLADDEARQRVAARFGVRGRFLLSVGTLEPRKNLRRLLEAYGELPADLRQRHPLLLVGGSGWKHGHTDSYLESRPELACVRRLGWVDDDDLVALYSCTELFLYPSLVEGFGLPVVEAMACGTAVLTSKVSSTAEVAGDAALLVDPASVADIRRGLEELLTRDGARRRLRERARPQAARFSWDKSARRVLELYDRLAAAP